MKDKENIFKGLTVSLKTRLPWIPIGSWLIFKAFLFKRIAWEKKTMISFIAANWRDKDIRNSYKNHKTSCLVSNPYKGIFEINCPLEFFKIKYLRMQFSFQLTNHFKFHESNRLSKVWEVFGYLKLRPDGSKIVGHDERSCEDRPNGHLNFRLVQTQAIVSDDQLKHWITFPCMKENVSNTYFTKWAPHNVHIFLTWVSFTRILGYLKILKGGNLIFMLLFVCYNLAFFMLFLFFNFYIGLQIE
jgi:hypothetical protein